MGTLDNNTVNRQIEELGENEEYELLHKEMLDAWPDVLNTIVNDEQYYSQMRRPMEWVKYLLEMNVPYGKKYRGLSSLKFFRSVKPIRTEDEDRKSLMAAWCLEILQAACLIADDMMDNSTTRRGKPCWYLVEGVGNTAINDVLILENIVNRIVDKYFLQESGYGQVMKLLHDTAIQTLLGENLDTKIGSEEFNLKSFTTEMYESVVEYKTSYYTYYAPAALALIVAGSTTEEEMVQLKDVLLKIGFLFQAQDDYLDCFGNEQVTGKAGTDIADGKCTWLIVKAVELASERQLKILQESYGREPHTTTTAIVKSIYKELKISQHFNRFEDEMYMMINDTIKKLPASIPKGPIFHALNIIYRRDI